MFTSEKDEIIIELEGEDIIQCVTGYLDSELLVGDSWGDYFFVNEGGNYVDKYTKKDVTDDQRDGLVAILCEKFGFVLGVSNTKYVHDKIVLVYPTSTTLETIEQIDRRLAVSGLGCNTWKIPI